MGFLDKAKAAATDLAAKADTALANSGMGGPGGGPDKYFRDLGVLAYLEANGRASSPEERERVMEALRAMEQRGEIRSFALQTAAAAAGTVPPPPGAAQAPPPPGAGAPPTGTMPPSAPPPAPVQESVEPQPPAPSAPPPPPPSWMDKGGSST